MRLHTMKRLTIIAAESLQNTVIKTLHDAEVHHYTFFNVRGVGEHTVKGEDSSANTRFEAIMSPHALEEVFVVLRERLLTDSAIIVYVQDVEVLRHQKFL